MAKKSGMGGLIKIGQKNALLSFDTPSKSIGGSDKADKEKALTAQELAALSAKTESQFKQTIDLIGNQFAVIHKIASELKEKKDSQWNKSSEALFKQFGTLLNKSADLEEKGTDPAEMRKWLIQYNKVTEQMASQLPWLKDYEPFKSDAKGARKAEEERKASIKELTNSLEKLIGGKRENDKERERKEKTGDGSKVLDVKDALFKSEHATLKLGLMGLLGPGAPIMALLGSIVNHEALIHKSNELGVKALKGILKGVVAGATAESTHAMQQHQDNVKELEFQKAEAKTQSLDELEREREAEEKPTAKSVEGVKSTNKHGGGALLGGLMGALELIMHEGKKVLSMFLPGKHSLLRKVFSYLLDFGKDFTKKGFTLIKDVGGELFSKGWSVVKSLSMDLIGGAWGLVKNIGSKLAGILIGGISTIGESLAAGVGGIVSSPVLLIGAAVVAAVAGIGYLAWKYRKQIMDFASNVWDKIKEGVSAAWHGITGFIGEGWDEVKKEFPNASKDLTTAASNTWNAVKDGATTAAANVETWAKEGWSAIKKSPIGEIAAIYGQIYTWMWDKVKNIAADAWDTIKSWWGAGKKALTPVAKKAAELSKKVSAVVGAATGSAAGAVAEATPKVAHAVGSTVKAGASALGFSDKTAAAAGSATARAVSSIGGAVSGGLGALSARFESAAGGSGAIGEDSTGGTSYGTYQLAAKTGAMNGFIKYLDTAAPDIAQTLKNAGNPNGGKNGTFANAWRKINAQNPKRFAALQYGYIKSTYYDVADRQIKNATGVDINDRSNAVQQVLWSTAVQHGPGGAAQIFDSILEANPKISDKDLINKVYEERAKHFQHSTPQVQAAVKARFKVEDKLALADLAKDQAGKSVPGSTGHTMLASASSDGVESHVPPVNKQSKSSEPIVASAKVPVINRKAPAPIVVASAKTEPVSPPAKPDYRNNIGGTLSVDTVPSFLSNEGLLILNTPGVA